jgi:hypothetical protein
VHPLRGVRRLSAELQLRVFTHPACSGCGEAVRQAWKAAEERPELAFRTVSLEQKEGLAEARGERVTTIPTAILTRDGREVRRWVGTPHAGAFAAALVESTEGV